MTTPMTRRRFMHTGMVLGTATAGFLSLEEKHLLAAMENGNANPAEKPKDTSSNPMPTGKIGKVQLSRLISGGNILSGWCHQRDLLFVSQLAQAYLTKQKQFETLQLMEENGINAMVIDQMQMDIINNYKQEWGGEMQTVVGVRQDWGGWGNPNWDDLKESIDYTIDQGATTLFLHGGYSDKLVQAGKKENLELIHRALEYIHQQGYPAGLGSHALEVPIECAQAGIVPDYYFKTFHHDQYWSAHPKERRKPFSVDMEEFQDHNEFHDNIFDLHAEKTSGFMKTQKVPWIAYKVLAAGAIPSESGFKFAFENGADFIAVGMFDFNVVDDVLIAKKVLKELKTRERAWCA